MSIIIEKILGADLNVLTNDGEHHTISLMNLIGNLGSSMSVDTDDNRIPRCMIDIHLECDKFDYGVDV